MISTSWRQRDYHHSHFQFVSILLSWLSLSSLASPLLPELSQMMGPLGNILQVAAGGGGAAGAGTGAAGVGAGTGTGAVGSVVGGLPVTTNPVVPAMMMSSVLPGIGIGLLAGTVIAELLIGKNEEKKHPGQKYYQPRGYEGYHPYGHHGRY